MAMHADFAFQRSHGTSDAGVVVAETVVGTVGGCVTGGAVGRGIVTAGGRVVGGATVTVGGRGRVGAVTTGGAVVVTVGGAGVGLEELRLGRSSGPSTVSAVTGASTAGAAPAALSIGDATVTSVVSAGCARTIIGNAIRLFGRSPEVSTTTHGVARAPPMNCRAGSTLEVGGFWLGWDRSIHRATDRKTTGVRLPRPSS